jgi:hypothetical protein
MGLLDILIPRKQQEITVKAEHTWKELKVLDPLSLVPENYTGIISSIDEQILAAKEMQIQGERYRRSLGGYRALEREATNKLSELEKGKRTLVEDIILLEYLDSKDIKVFDKKAVSKYQGRKAGLTKEWKTCSLSAYNQVIPMPILNLCETFRNGAEGFLRRHRLSDTDIYYTCAHVWIELLDYRKRRTNDCLDPFIMVKYSRSNPQYIAVWEEPGFESNKYYIPAKKALDSILGNKGS